MLGDIMKIKKILLSLAVVFGLTSFGSLANAACGNITIANMNWASANFMAEVDKTDRSREEKEKLKASRENEQ